MRKCVQGVIALLVALISAAKAMALLPDHTQDLRLFLTRHVLEEWHSQAFFRARP